MRVFFAFACAALVTAVITDARPASAAGDALTGKMAAFSYLLSGPWSCSTKLPAMGGQPAQTQQATVTFEAVAGNVIHNHIAGGNYAGDSYFGYSDRMNQYWEADADSMGSHGFLTSPDGKVYTGNASMGPVTMQETTTYTRLSPTNATVHEVLSGPEGPATIDSTCSR